MIVRLASWGLVLLLISCGGGGGKTQDASALGACPATRPGTGTACSGPFSCTYTDLCRCNVCCTSTFHCVDGGIAFLGNNDGCLQVTCAPDAQ